ncbi:hypothetical protein D3C85_1389700 [compost metagenome]
MLEQPAGSHQAAEFLVVGEVQFDRAMGGSGHRLQRAHGEREAGEVAFADGGGAAVQAAVFDLGAIRIMCPAVAGRHHVAMGIERHAAPAVAVFATHDQVGDGLHPIIADVLGGHGMGLGLQAEALQQFGGALGVGRVVAGRRVGGHAHQFLQEADFFIKVGVNPGVESGVVGHGFK